MRKKRLPEAEEAQLPGLGDRLSPATWDVKSHGLRPRVQSEGPTKVGGKLLREAKPQMPAWASRSLANFKPRFAAATCQPICGLSRSLCLSLALYLSLCVGVCLCVSASFCFCVCVPNPKCPGNADRKITHEAAACRLAGFVSISVVLVR